MPSYSLPVRARFWAQAAVSAAAAVLLVVTLISREWIEEIFGVDPDGGSGELEWLIVAGLAAVGFALGLTARREWRRPRPAIAAG